MLAAAQRLKQSFKSVQRLHASFSAAPPRRCEHYLFQESKLTTI
jgi:hypothetical protein